MGKFIKIKQEMTSDEKIEAIIESEKMTGTEKIEAIIKITTEDFMKSFDEAQKIEKDKI